jgi:hypothetical protein
METRRVLSGLSYFSIFFAGFIFPLVVYFVSNDEVTKMHAKKALLSHLIPLVPFPLVIFAIFQEGTNSQFPVLTIVFIIIMVLISIIVTIWNIVKGVKAFRME